MSSLFFLASLAFADPLRDLTAKVIADNPTVQAAVADRDRALGAEASEAHRYALSISADGSLSRNVNAQFLQGGLVSVRSQSTSLAAGLSQPFSFGGAASIDLGLTRTTSGLATATEKTSQWRPTLSVGFSQPVLQGAGTRVGRQGLRLARLDASSARSGLASTASGTLRDAMAAWCELYDAVGAEAVALRSLDTARAQERETETRISVGALAPADRWTYQTRTASLEEALAQSRQSTAVRQASVERLLGSPVALPSPEAVLVLPELPPGDPVVLAVDASPDVQQVRIAQQAAEDRLSTAGEVFRPRLDLGVTAQVNGFGGTLDEAMTDFGELNGWGGMVTASFSGTPDPSRRLAERDQARDALRTARARVAELEAAVRSQVTAAVANERSAAERTALAERTAKIATQQLGAAKTRLQTGGARPIEVREAEDDLASAEKRLIRARVDQLEARLDILHLTGKLLDTYAVAPF